MAKTYILSFLIHNYKYKKRKKKKEVLQKKRELRKKKIIIPFYTMIIKFIRTPFYFLPKIPQKPLPVPDDFSVRAANDSSGYLTKLAAKSK